MAERVNPLLERKELLLEAEHVSGATPTRVQLRDAIAAKLNADPKLIRILWSKTITNSWKTRASADVYATPEAAERLTPRHIYERSLTPEEREQLKTSRKKAAAEKSKPSPKKK
ncbi:MAG: hypothetical protein ACE5PO_07665 [Candidatus Bathyarchaeia archaeon]